MKARAVFKGVVRFGEASVPVKLYSAVEDRSVRFRLLHEEDLVPVQQVLVSSQTEEPVPYEKARRAFPSKDGALVMLEADELAELVPEPTRDIVVTHFVPSSAINHRHYLRPYYLGPDGDVASYYALSIALDRSGRIGVANWTMRNKRHVGALRLHLGYPLLVTLKTPHEVIAADELSPPKGKPLDERELGMARQLIGMLAAPFEQEDYQDEYRHRVLELIETRKRGGKVEPSEPRPARPPEDLLAALEASLREERDSAAR